MDKRKKKPEFNLDELIGFLQRYWKILAVAVVIIIAGIVLVRCTGGKDKAPESSDMESGEKVIEITDNITGTTPADSSLKKDAYPEINELITNYFKAKLACDVNTLSQLVYPNEGITEGQLQYEINGVTTDGVEDFRRIEDFQNIACYTKPGLLTDTYALWVYCEIKFAHAQTPAPALYKMYICTDENGVYAYNGTTEGEIESYLDSISQDADVLELVNNVTNKLTEALNSDAELKSIFEEMGDSQETETESETLSEQVPETESIAESSSAE